MSNIKNFKTGLYKKESNGYYYGSTKTLLCGCGHSFKAQRYDSMTCEKCGNENFKEVSRIPKLRTLIDSRLDLIDKGDTHFHIRKTEVTAKIDDGKRIIELIAGKQAEMKVDFKSRTIQLFNEKGELIENSFDNLEAFSKNINNITNFISVVSTEKNEELIRYFINNSQRHTNERYIRIHRGIQTILTNPYIEVLYNCGFYPSTIWNYKNTLKINETNPSKIIGVPKYLVKYLRKMQTLYSYDIQRLLTLDKKFTGNNLKTILTILDEESEIKDILNICDRLIELHDEYGYRDLKRTVLYLAREVKLQQGIDKPSNAITILRDYARMCVEMNFEFEKYPKSLKKDHDIILLNYKTKQDEKKKKEFAEVVSKEDYSRLAFKDKEYSIVIPQEPHDVINEGKSLSHCVASYVNDIIKEKCKILFMRPTKETDESLITIEVRDNKYIRQIRGKANRKPKQHELNFIGKWAEKLDLTVSGY